MTDLVRFAVFALPLGLIFNLVGYLPESLRLFSVYLFLLLPIFFRQPEHRSTQLIAVAVAVLTNTLAPRNAAFELAVLLGAHFYVWAGYRRTWRTPYTAVVFFGLLYVFLFMSPQGFHPLDTMAQGVSQWYSRLMRQPCNLGYTYLNLGSALLFLTLSVFLIRDGASLVRSVCFLVLLVLVTAVGVKFLLFKADFDTDFLLKLETGTFLDYRQYAQFAARLAALAFPAILFLAHLGLFMVFHGSWIAGRMPSQAVPARLRWREQFGPLLGIGLAIVLMAALAPMTWLDPAKPRQALFYGKGVVSFSKPVYGGYGTPAAGMYGIYVDLLGLFGFSARVVDAIPDRLDDVDLLILTNLDHPLPDGVPERVWQFVSEGGHLWVLGDHTFIKNGRHHINELLRPCHIRLANDSAKNLLQGWFESYELRLSQPLLRLRNDAENSLSILVGASLQLEPPAAPLILGRYGFSDAGRTENDDKVGYLGDFKLTHNERLGDLVLVAAEAYGKGKVMVFGDTTSFFNANTGKTCELVRAVLTWFRTDPAAGWPAPRSAIWAPVALLAMVLICLLRWPSASLPPAILGAVAVYAVLWQAQAQPLPMDEAASRQRLAIIDYTHNPRVSKHALMPDAVFGLALNIMRFGWIPVETDNWGWPTLRGSRCLFLIAPQRPFTRAEISDVLRFVHGGGDVVMTCGRKEVAACRTLLEALGLEVLNVPLGRFFDRKAFGSPVSFYSAWALAVHTKEASIITADDSWPLIVAVRHGKGQFVLVGDSEFLLNKNLEGDGNHDPNNIEFLKRLFAYLGEGKMP